MTSVLLIDFGSTYTKVTAVDVESPAILGTASAHTTILTDIGDGLDEALERLNAQTGPLSFAARYACSSAAGGLRMIACGLVPSLTVEAARRAALGAGAKVIRVYSYELTAEDGAEIGSLKPDILLLTGGTDGGNKENILQNAGALAHVPGDFPIVVAGNRAVTAQCLELLSGSSHPTIPCANVMPVFNSLNIEPVQEVIRELFLRRIVQAKGLSRQQSLLDGIMMPTPAAVLEALKLLSEGVPGQRGMGDLVAVDLGGATTDVYSIADGLPADAMTLLRGLPEPHAKRTVEGDIGMRYSAQGVVEAVGMDKIASLSGLSEPEIMSCLARVKASPDVLSAQNDPLARMDFALAVSAIDRALVRHAGIIERVYTPNGMLAQQTGKDLTRVETMILTGGALAFGGNAGKIAKAATESPGNSNALRPAHARALLDKRYILAAMGLLSGQHPHAAFTLMKRLFLQE